MAAKSYLSLEFPLIKDLNRNDRRILDGTMYISIDSICQDTRPDDAHVKVPTIISYFHQQVEGESSLIPVWIQSTFDDRGRVYLFPIHRDNSEWVGYT